VHIVGFIIRIYHHARSPELQTVDKSTSKKISLCKSDRTVFLNINLIRCLGKHTEIYKWAMYEDILFCG